MSNLNGKNVVLVGGAGFIGHHLALHLKEHGANISVIDGLSVNNLLYLHDSNQNVTNRELYISFVNNRLALLRKARIPVYVEDARNYFKMCKLMTTIKPQVVVVLAAVAQANKSNKNPYETFDHSLRTLENALDSARDIAKHFIYFSSSMVYGCFPTDIVTEETNCNPLGIYGALKFAGEKMVISYHQAFDLPYTIIRPSALYGERCISRRVGQIFVENAIIAKEIMVQGDGSDKLDFTYIEDLVNGVRNVIENKNSINQTFNLTYGSSCSISKMAEIVKEHFQRVKINYVPKDKFMPYRGTLCIDKAREMIGYEPQYSLARGLVKYINWYKELFKWKSRSLATVAEE